MALTIPPAAKKASPTQKAAPSVPKPEQAYRLKIRMYRRGLGDCVLLRFSRPNTADTFNVLIDCGLISVATGAKAKMNEVANDIASVCNGRIDIVVMTHEHWDHASGFSTQQAQAVFDSIDIKAVWYAWTEDPSNELGIKLRKERADKTEALAAAVSALSGITVKNPSMARVERVENLLNFFGLDSSAIAGLAAGSPAIGKTRAAFEYLKNRVGVTTQYCYPHKPPLTFNEVDGLRVYFLGPPQDENYIKKSSPTKSGREVYELAAEANLANGLRSAFGRLSGADGSDTADDCPFDDQFRIRTTDSKFRRHTALAGLMSDTWDRSDESWRQIEYDWTQSAETLALNLDTHTNNTCLVLAFEFIDTGEVFLFPADAQVGNWLSWQDRKWKVKSSTGMTEVTAPDLLSRTVFYKVGHHGSHNATLRALGLEQMTSESLVAYVPVNVCEARKNRWNGMPFPPLVDRLREKTHGRLLQMDQPLPTALELKNLPKEVSAAFLESTVAGPNDLYFECSF